MSEQHTPGPWRFNEGTQTIVSNREMATIEQGPWKSGNEYLPYHPSASHVDPDYRDGWNACWRLTHQVSPSGPQEISRLTADEALQALADQAQELGMYDQPTDRRPNLGSITSAVVREMAPEAKAKDSVNQTGALRQEPVAADHIRTRLEALRAWVTGLKDEAPAIRNQAAILINDTLQALARRPSTDEREEFEAWAAAQESSGINRHWSWRAWTARAAIASSAHIAQRSGES